MDRRKFLSATAAGLAFSTTAPRALAFADPTPKRVGLIGTGWYGKIDLIRLIQVAPVEVVSLCDVDKRNLAEAADIITARQPSHNRPRTYEDYREMLAEKDLDIVLIATPDHWHALMAIAAMEAGADLYLQKPISVDVVEGQAILAAARKLGRVVQVGLQRRSTPHLIDAMNKVVRTGKLGKIGLVEVYSYYHMRDRRNPPDGRAPDHLNYELWTGPAPMRPYCGMPWRAFMEYSNGIVGDMCVHMLDMVRWMLGLGWPTRVSSAGGILVDKQSKATTSDTQQVTFDFGDLQVVWQHRSWGAPPDEKYPWGATFHGDKGTLKASTQSYDFTPLGPGDALRQEALFEYDKFPEDETEPRLERHVASAIRRHMLDLQAAIENQGKPVCDIEEGHISTASCILGNIALQLGRTLAWDPATAQVVGDEEANRLLRRPYRGEWVHPEPADYA
ncbi:MAG: Gfo/Idh/MocA family oxidoreductase [Planctomycetes bacterium]|nr:Gfo/Idh/MocA family oxidoreductase [Planctomycetota bacterium]